MRPIDNSWQLLIVHRLRAKMHLELQAVSLGGFDAGHRGFPGAWYATELVVFPRIERIDADADSHDADLNQRLGCLVVNQHAVGTEDHHEAELHGMTRDVEDVGTNQRLSTRDHEQTAFVHFRNLINQTKTFFGG